MTKLLLKIFIKDYSNTNDPAVRDKYMSLAGFTGIVANLLLFLIKGALGLIAGSVSIVADAFNNNWVPVILVWMGFAVVSAVISLIAFLPWRKFIKNEGKLEN